MLVAVLLLLLPGCRSKSWQGNGPLDSTRSGGATLTTKQAAEQSARRVEAQARYATGLSHDLNQQPDAAIEEYIFALKAEPSNEQLALEISRRLVLAKQLERALEVVELAAAVPTASSAIYAQIGVLYRELDRYQDAEKATRKAIKMAPEILLSYYNLYALYLEQGEIDKAIAVLQEAADQTSDNSDYWLDLAEVYANFYRSQTTFKELALDQMKHCLERATKLGVRGNSRRLKLADGLALSGEPDKAIAILLELMNEFKDSPSRRNIVQQKLLSLYISTQDADGAITQLTSIVREHPTNPQANFLLASFALEKGDNKTAIEYFQKTIQLDADLEQAYYSLVGLYLDSARSKEAVTLLETARGRFEKSFVLEYYSAVAYSQLEAYEAAVQHYTNAEIIGRASDSANLDHRFYFGFGAQQERLKLFDQAVSSFQKSIDLKSDFAPSLNYLGYMWADQGTNLDQARKYIQKAVDLEPENSAYLDSLAWVLYKLDQPNLALIHMEDAIKFHADDDPDAVLFDHLADIQLAAGNAAKAREAWEKSLELTDDPVVRAKLDDLLKANPGADK